MINLVIVIVKELIFPSKPHTNGTPSHWDTILAEVDAMQLSGQCKTDIPKALIDRMKDNQRIIGDRAGNIRIRNIGDN